MRVKFGILIDVDATLVGARVVGPDTVALELNVGSKPASITMSKAEGTALIDALRNAGVSGSAMLGSVVLPKGKTL